MEEKKSCEKGHTSHIAIYEYKQTKTTDTTVYDIPWQVIVSVELTLHNVSHVSEKLSSHQTHQ